jgi:prepilin-type N-terminal cleavage/methylation domain-containing protein
MNQRKKSFTLIELIIVVVIIGILALVAIPKYYASVTKSQKNAVYASLNTIRQAMLSYYAVYGIYPVDNTWPITVTVDGDTVINISNPSTTSWRYQHASTGSGYCSTPALAAWSQDGTYAYCMYLSSGGPYTTCGGCRS